jgi:hypothetical protein
MSATHALTCVLPLYSRRARTELGSVLKTPSERDDVARLVTDALYPDLLTSASELALLVRCVSCVVLLLTPVTRIVTPPTQRALGPALSREVSEAGGAERVLAIDSSAVPSLARCLMLRYGRRRCVRAC